MTPMRLVLSTQALTDYTRQASPAMQRLFLMTSFRDVELWTGAHSLYEAMKTQPVAEQPLKSLHACALLPEHVAEALGSGCPDFDAALTQTAAESVNADAIIVPAGTSGAAFRHEVLTPEGLCAHMLASHGLRYDEVRLNGSPS